MPTYHYMCSTCGQRFEVFHAMSATPPATCADVRAMEGAPVGAVSGASQNCMGAVERELTGGTGLIFKGSGFYITDYKDGRKGAGASSGDGAASEAPGKSEAKDSKASAAPEAEKANTSAAASTGNSEAPVSAKPAVASGGGESPSAPNKA